MGSFSGYYFCTSNRINSPANNFQSLLKVLSMFKISILYDDTIITINVTDSVGIKYINCGKNSFFIRQ